MNVTSVQIHQLNPGNNVRAFLSVVLDGELVVRGIRVVDTVRGLIVAMPSQKKKAPCPHCDFKNQWGQNFCGNCGTALATYWDRKGRPYPHYEDHVRVVSPDFLNSLENQILHVYHQESKNGRPD